MKITRKTNFRLVVEPRSLGDYGFIRMSDNRFGRTDKDVEDEYLQRCKEIESDIIRHADNVSSVEIVYDTYSICSHCGLLYELDEDGIPNCCQQEISEFIANEMKE